MLTKLVNGERIKCTPEEEADIIAEWDANSQPKTQAEIDAENDQMITDFISQNRNIMKAIVIALNKGTLIPGANVKPAELKAIIKAEL